MLYFVLWRMMCDEYQTSRFVDLPAARELAKVLREVGYPASIIPVPGLKEERENA